MKQAAFNPKNVNVFVWFLGVAENQKGQLLTHDAWPSSGSNRTRVRFALDFPHPPRSLRQIILSVSHSDILQCWCIPWGWAGRVRAVRGRGQTRARPRARRGGASAGGAAQGAGRVGEAFARPIILHMMDARRSLRACLAVVWNVVTRVGEADSRREPQSDLLAVMQATALAAWLRFDVTLFAPPGFLGMLRLDELLALQPRNSVRLSGIGHSLRADLPASHTARRGVSQLDASM